MSWSSGVEEVEASGQAVLNFRKPGASIAAEMRYQVMRNLAPCSGEIRLIIAGEASWTVNQTRRAAAPKPVQRFAIP